MRTMSSSTSSSDKRMDGEKHSWLSFCVTYGVSLAVIVIGLVGLIYVIDPYDTGRSRMFEREGVRPQGPRTAAPSRIRDPQFNAVIFGNSRTQLLSPERIDAQTGLKFVQLSVPGSGPKEQLAMLDWYLDRHPGETKAVVMSMDTFWCQANPDLPPPNPFPFWLFEKDRLTYTSELLRYVALQEMFQRFSYLNAKNPRKARADGYWDYEDEQKSNRTDEEIRRFVETSPAVVATHNDSGSYPAAVRLKEAAGRLSPDTVLILYFPPVYIGSLVREGSSEARQASECKAALQQAAKSAHVRTLVLDWWKDRPETHDAAGFFDQIHYRHPLAIRIEEDISAILNRELAPDSAENSSNRK